MSGSSKPFRWVCTSSATGIGAEASSSGLDRRDTRGSRVIGDFTFGRTAHGKKTNQSTTSKESGQADGDLLEEGNEVGIEETESVFG